jgi:arabinogalactan endo-1,4-beta-galactosidase
LTEKVKNYTETVCNEFASHSLPVTLISIGNEITQGLLWPLGKTTSSSARNTATLLHAASAGIKKSSLTSKPKIMIHLDNGWKWDTQEWWYDLVLKQGPLKTSDFDIMGVSYYPFYNVDATLSALKSSLASMAKKYDKGLVVAETNWPVSCSSPKYAFPADVKSIPFSAAGQSTWIKDVARIVAGTPGGQGLFYWEPAWIDNAGLGSSCGSNLMFNNGGKMLSSLAVFESI